MKLTVLIDNQTLIDRYYRGEPGVSYWIEADGQTVLFDTGYSGLFLENGLKMGIDAATADVVALSHGHNDHTWGLEALIRQLTERQAERDDAARPMLVAHPEAFLPKRYEGLEIGSLIGGDMLERQFAAEFSREPVRITERLFWLGEVPRVHSFEPERAIGETYRAGQWQPDMLPDDSALAYAGDEGLVIVTGCSHAGICNIVTHAMAVTGERRVRAVVGGFHLLKPDPERWAATVAFLREIGVRTLHAGHCTGFEARMALARELDQQEIGVGTVLTFQ